MAVRTREEILEEVRLIIGDRTDDEALALIEDVNDTVNDYEARLSDQTDWRARFEENDREWRTKYRERFFDGTGPEDLEDETVIKPDEDEIEVKTSFDELFETK